MVAAAVIRRGSLILTGTRFNSSYCCVAADVDPPATGGRGAEAIQRALRRLTNDRMQLIDLMYMARTTPYLAQGAQPRLTEKQLSDYGAGFESGWRAAISTLKLHKQLEVQS
jgi:hypothetical protein